MSAGQTGSGWYYQKTGATGGQQPVGPFSWDELFSHARGRALTPDDVVWSQETGNWLPATQIPGLFPAPAAPPVPPAPAAGYAAPYGYGAPAAPPRRSSPLLWVIPVTVVIVAAAVLLGLYFGVWRDGDDKTASTTTSSLAEGPFVQNEGEIFLEPAGVAGPDSFGGEQFVTAGPTTTFSMPTTTMPVAATTTTLTPTTAAGGAQPVTVASYPGDTPALYGGSKSKQIADKEGQLAYLAANPAKAKAFCMALNSDPNLRWSGGSQVTPEQLPAYFDELTPMLLTRDTRVTNHGYRDGRPTPRQSVLQAGQLVLVDQYGVPRVRCECGNPLIPPKPVRTTPTYTGPRWPGFDPTTIIVIQQTTVIINIFTVVDVHTGLPFGRPAGSSGGQDGPPPGASGTIGATTTTAPVVGGPIAGDELAGLWSGTFTVTEITIPEEAADALEEEGCSLATLEAMKGEALPMTMEVTVDAGGRSGTAVMLVDVSSLNTGDGEEVSSEPETFTFTIEGDTVTFESTGGDTSTTMTGTLRRQGQTLVMSGTMFAGESGMGVSADWQMTKQIVM
jgi:hypothetical protein